MSNDPINFLDVNGLESDEAVRKVCAAYGISPEKCDSMRDNRINPFPFSQEAERGVQNSVAPVATVDEDLTCRRCNEQCSEIFSDLGISSARDTGVQEVATIGVRTLSFPALEKAIKVGGGIETLASIGFALRDFHRCTKKCIAKSPRGKIGG